MKIGQLTLYRNYNYGSLLQCYALQQFFSCKGIEIETIVPKSNWCWKVNSLLRKVSFIFSCFRYPGQYASYKKFLEESKRSCFALDENTRGKMDDFILKNIREREVSFSELKNNVEYSCYIAGSDQVWSVAGPTLNPYFFLRFSPNKKKYSYAASFGSDTLPKWHKKKLFRFVSEFSKISIREKSAIEFFQDARGINPIVNMDPALLQDSFFWREKEQIPEGLKDGGYILLYFLNEPTDFAIKHIENIVKENPGLKIYSFPYAFKKIETALPNMTHLFLSPMEFVGAIDNANLLCTDSFHGVVFSINLGVKFFNYRRAYKSMSQNGRINSLLEHYNLTKAVPSDVKDTKPISYNIDTELSQDRFESISYLQTIIDEIR